MQCPSCNHIPLAGSEQDPNTCPKCGVNYAEVIRRKAAAAAMKPPATQALPSRLDNAREAVRQGRQARESAEHQQRNQTPAPVRIVDIEMPFWSMVVFLIKLALASIPAAIILYAAAGIFLGVISRF